MREVNHFKKLTPSRVQTQGSTNPDVHAAVGESSDPTMSPPIGRPRYHTDMEVYTLRREIQRTVATHLYRDCQYIKKLPDNEVRTYKICQTCLFSEHIRSEKTS